MDKFEESLMKLEKYFTISKIDFIKRVRDSEISYIFEEVKEIDSDIKNFEVKIVFRKDLVLGKDSVFLYTLISLNAFNRKILQQLLRYTTLVNNVLEIGTLLYDFDEERFRYKIEYPLFEPTILFDIINIGVDYSTSISDIFTNILYDLMTYDLDVLSAYKLTVDKLSQIQSTFRNDHTNVEDVRADIERVVNDILQS
jgi:hypothetical protein